MEAEITGCCGQLGRSIQGVSSRLAAVTLIYWINSYTLVAILLSLLVCNAVQVIWAYAVYSRFYAIDKRIRRIIWGRNSHHILHPFSVRVYIAYMHQSLSLINHTLYILLDSVQSSKEQDICSVSVFLTFFLLSTNQRNQRDRRHFHPLFFISTGNRVPKSLSLAFIKPWHLTLFILRNVSCSQRGEKKKDQSPFNS